MKICYFARAKNIYFQRWYDYFVNRGHEVHVISGDDSHIEIDVKMPAGVKLHYVSEKKIFNQKISAVYNLLRLPLIIKEIKNILNEISPDIIHAHVVTPSGFWAALSGVHPFIVTPAGSDVIILARKYLLYNLITRYTLKRADLITSDSLVLQKCIFECGGDRGKSHIIQNGVDLTKFNPQIDKNKLRRKYNLGNAPIILSARGLTSKGVTSVYNIEFLIKAIPNVLKVFPDAKLLFCYSQDSTLPELRRLAKDLAVEHSINFIGFVEN